MVYWFSIWFLHRNLSSLHHGRKRARFRASSSIPWRYLLHRRNLYSLTVVSGPSAMSSTLVVSILFADLLCYLCMRKILLCSPVIGCHSPRWAEHLSWAGPRSLDGLASLGCFALCGGCFSFLWCTLTIEQKRLL